MTVRHRVDFSQLEWRSPIAGVRHKFLDQGGLRLRLVEYSKEMPLHWCEKGHHGYLIDGRMQVEFDGGTELYGRGDGIDIPEGPDHRHRATVLSEQALVFFIEKP
jgi:quercetin dioxygenase-like cupin family protein